MPIINETVARNINIFPTEQSYKENIGLLDNTDINLVPIPIQQLELDFDNLKSSTITDINNLKTTINNTKQELLQTIEDQSSIDFVIPVTDATSTITVKYSDYTARKLTKFVYPSITVLGDKPHLVQVTNATLDGFTANVYFPVENLSIAPDGQPFIAFTNKAKNEQQTATLGENITLGDEYTLGDVSRVCELAVHLSF